MFQNSGGGTTAAPNPKPKSPPVTQPVAPSNPGGGFVNPTPPTTTQPPDVTTTTTPPFPGIPAVLGGDPNYQQLLAFDTAASGQDLATMNARIAQMQGYYGSDSDPLSILGRVFQAYQDRNRLIANTLAGHGMIDSGETGWQGARATLAYQQQELDARMKLQQFIQGLQDAYNAAQRQQAFNEMQAGQNAVTAYLNNPANQPTSTTTTPAPVVTPPTLGTGGTQAVYGPDNPDGTPGPLLFVPSSQTFNPFK